MTTDEALATTRLQLNETTAAFWTDAEIYGYLWEGETLLVGKLGGVQANTTHTTVTDTSAYTRPTGYLRIDAVVYDGHKLRKGTQRDRDYLDGMSYGSTRPTGQPEMYFEWGSQIRVSPVPQSAANLEYWGRKMPTVITNATAFTLQDESLQAMLPDYAVWKCSLKDQELARADRHQKAWEQNFGMAISIWSDRESQDMIPHVRDEDEYPGGVLGMD